MVTLGALVAVAKIMSWEALQQAVLACIPKGMETINIQVLTAE